MLLAKIANAQTSLSNENTSAGQLLMKITASIVNPIIILFFIGALCIFVYGVFEFIKGADNEKARADGQQHMMWGIIGLFIMVAVFAIIQVITNFVGGLGAGQTPNIWILK